MKTLVSTLLVTCSLSVAADLSWFEREWTIDLQATLEATPGFHDNLSDLARLAGMQLMIKDGGIETYFDDKPSSTVYSYSLSGRDAARIYFSNGHSVAVRRMESGFCFSLDPAELVDDEDPAALCFKPSIRDATD